MANTIAILREELQELRNQIASLESEMHDLPGYGPAEAAAGIVWREVDRALLEQLRDRAASIERVLSDEESDGYGICERCGRPIHPDRLAVLPGTTICSRCAAGARKAPAGSLQDEDGRDRERVA
jgi:DnaK suppressor protein